MSQNTSCRRKLFGNQINIFRPEFLNSQNNRKKYHIWLYYFKLPGLHQKLLISPEGRCRQTFFVV